MSCRRATSERSCSTSAVRGERLRVEMEGVATSVILSVSWARASRDISPAEAKTILTWLGRRWRKSSRRNLLSGLGPAVVVSGAKVARVSCPEFLRGEELLETALLRSRGALDQLCLEDVVRFVFRRGEEEVPNLGREFWCKRGHHVVETGPLVGDVAR